VDPVTEPVIGLRSHTPSRPTVAIVIANFNGERDLPTCLDSIAAMSYPSDKVTTIVVENGSSDGSRALLAERYPWVRVLEQDTNLGFAPAVNLGVEAADTELVALLNNDMAVDEKWLTALVDSYDPDNGYICVAGTILNWDGTKVDYAEGVLNWHGMGDQVGFGLPVDQVSIRDGRELLFACGGSMLIDRKVYLDLGGLDADYFAYFEDVDLGWRLWLSGYKVRLAKDARCQHRHNGTSGKFPFYQRALLYERNALMTIVKNLDDENLGKFLGPALLLLMQRTIEETGSDRDAYQFGVDGEDGSTEPIPRVALARMHAVADIIGDLDKLMVKRRAVQLKRLVSDQDVLARFGRPFKPLGAGGERYIAAAESVRRNFRIEDAFVESPATRIAVLAYDQVGEKMAGPAVRSWEMARALAKSCHVTFLSKWEVGRHAPGVEVLRFDNEEELRQLLVETDVVIVHGFALNEWRTLRSTRALMVVDLYDPWVFENLEMRRRTDTEHPDAYDRIEDYHGRVDVEVQSDLLDRGDFFICASERQRDYWLGMLTARGRVDRVAYGVDPTLRTLIDVVPYGSPDGPPVPVGADPVLRGVHPAMTDDSIIVTWGGGTWEWFDPVLVLDAFAAAHAVEPRLRLFFLGLDPVAGAGVPKMRVAQELRNRADVLGLTDTAVVFGSWAPYDQRGQYLAESDIGIIATKDLAEVRLAFRSRLLDHFWAGLPTIASEGDVLADLLRERDAGIVTPIGDRDAVTNAILKLAEDHGLRSTQATNARALAERYSWENNVEPVRQLAATPAKWRTMRDQRPNRRQIELTEDAQILLLQRRSLLNDYGSLAKLFHFVGNSKILLPIARRFKRLIMR
jgi:GT2 family glycosyltransferase/glycosyltransferase involved in cell wall biosynthesis